MTRWWIFAIALVVRGIIAFVFFGSVDVTNSMLDAERMIAGVLPSRLTVPYFPGVQTIIWAAGMIAVSTALPVGFLYKIFGCLFDAVIAAAVFSDRGKVAGLLYAFAPVPILIVSIHGQWDAIALALFIGALVVLRRPGKLAAALTGVLFVVSVIVKPIAVPFVVFLFPAPWRLREREERLRVLAILGGMTVTLALYVNVLRAIGDPLINETIVYILDYARGGVTYFGLPFALGIKQNRLPIIASILLLLPLYCTKRISREEAITIAYAFLLGTCGLGAQYLSWIVPFLLMCGYVRFAAVYSLVAGIFLVLTYSSMGADIVMNLGAFGPLRGAAWLAPGGTRSMVKAYLLVIFGDLLVPLVNVGWLAVVGWRLAAGWKDAPANRQPPTANQLPLALALAITAIIFCYSLTLPRMDANTFGARMRAKVSAYEVVRIHDVLPGQPTWVVPDGAGVAHDGGLDAAMIAYAWIGVWTCAAYLTAARKRL